jgi:predicted amidohydrolase YtcJ
VLIRNAEIGGRGPLDLRIDGARIAEVGAGLARHAGELVHDARRGALLPGLHDHHIHLYALAAAEGSLACGPPALHGESELVAALRAQPGDGWLRGVGYHESVAGLPDRERLDAWLPTRPLRIQHRSGALWLLNTRALDALGVGARAGDADPPGLERDATGRATGRLVRGDAWLRTRLPDAAPPLAPVGAALARRGVTGVTDTGPDNDAALLARLCAAADAGALPQRLRVMGRPGLPTPASPRVARGAVKALLDEARLPGFDAFVAAIRAAHTEGRGLAVHCVTRAELVFALEAFRSAGARRGDRLEHASVAPPDLVALAAALPLAVVTQPHFVAERGDAYLRDVEPAERRWLYRARGWLAAGVPLAAGSDAPYGAADPWRAMAAAVARETAAGATLGADEALTPEQALALFTSTADAPGGAARPVAAGAAADLCLLDRPWRDARERLFADDVAATWCAGRLVWDRDAA